MEKRRESESRTLQGGTPRRARLPGHWGKPGRALGVFVGQVRWEWLWVGMWWMCPGSPHLRPPQTLHEAVGPRRPGFSLCVQLASGCSSGVLRLVLICSSQWLPMATLLMALPATTGHTKWAPKMCARQRTHATKAHSPLEMSCSFLPSLKRCKHPERNGGRWAQNSMDQSSEPRLAGGRLPAVHTHSLNPPQRDTSLGAARM